VGMIPRDLLDGRTVPHRINRSVQPVGSVPAAHTDVVSAQCSLYVVQGIPDLCR
jgi:hypothetical protein